MLDQTYKREARHRAGLWRLFAISVLFLLTLTFASASQTLAQTSTSSTPTSDATGSVITINGQKYVLVSEKTFGKVEIMVKEVPALRQENSDLKAEKDNADKVIAGQATVHDLDQKTIGALQSALASQEKATASEKEAYTHSQAALELEKQETARQKARADKWKKRATVTTVVAAVLGFALWHG